jgi:hypothetical protein
LLAAEHHHASVRPVLPGLHEEVERTVADPPRLGMHVGDGRGAELTGAGRRPASMHSELEVGAIQGLKLGRTETTGDQGKADGAALPRVTLAGDRRLKTCGGRIRSEMKSILWRFLDAPLSKGAMRCSGGQFSHVR